METARRPYETLEGQGVPGVRQLSVFLDNRLGQLLRLTQVIEQKDIRIMALSIVDSVDYAVVRVLCDDPDVAIQLLREEGFAVSIAELLVVRLQTGRKGLLNIWSALLSSEINVGYAYPLLPGHQIGAAIAVSVDNIEIAIDTLQRHQFEVLGEADLRSGG